MFFGPPMFSPDKVFYQLLVRYVYGLYTITVLSFTNLKKEKLLEKWSKVMNDWIWMMYAGNDSVIYIKHQNRWGTKW